MDDFGSSLGVRTPEKWMKVTALILGVLALCAGIPMLVMFISNPPPLFSEETLVTFAVLVAGPGCFFGFYALHKDRVEVFERGFAVSRATGSFRFGYEEVSTFSYSVEEGENFDLRTGKKARGFSLRIESGGRVVRLFSGSFGGNDALMGRLRDELAPLIATRLEGELASKGRVHWTKADVGESMWTIDLWITRTGLEITTRLASSTTTELSFAGPMTLFLADGWLRARTPDGKERLALEMGEANFYPGLLVLRRAMGESWRLAD